ncbi:hypothetical protein Pmani_017312 [Petrolisthes manimaculis]|uniref:Sodium/glucose cotransporter 4 n=1 Tax=Petrolisthes manimaculis TaxID=1843537 RepID=A0AAE1PPU4_9EUCA|nr:hypothetical protein Pmani_017312 [Petrolisthes manimaculis]
MVQRALAAKSLSHAQGGTLFAGYMKILPLFIIILPGMISRVLFTDEIACVDPEECYRFCGSQVSCSNTAFPKLVLEFLPSGVRGIMLSVMLSAIMSNLTSIFNSASTLFTMDLWATWRPKAKPREQLLVGRLFILLLVGVSICWVPVIQQSEGGQIFVYIQVIAAYLAPPIAAIYLLAVLWTRLNEAGTFWSLILGFVLGIVRMGLDFYYTQPPCYEPDLRPAIIRNLHYMYFATAMFWLTVVVAVIISLMTEPPQSWKLIRTTYFKRMSREERPDDQEERERAENELLEMTDRKSESGDGEVQLPWYRRVYNFIFGYNNSKEAQEQVVAMNEHLAAVTTLHQSRRVKCFLNILLVIILTTAVALFTFFSINPFTEQEVYDIQRQKLKELGYEDLI